MKKVYYLVSMLFVFFVFSMSVSANTLNKISMDIYVDPNGDAHITEVWNAKLNEGTEGYHPYYNMGNSTITDFSVVDDSGTEYTYLNSWNVKSSFDSKKYKNGIYKTGNEVDLCWGISNYGSRTYTLK